MPPSSASFQSLCVCEKAGSLQGKMIVWVVFLALGSCVRAGVVVTSYWKPELRDWGVPRAVRDDLDDLPDMCLETADKHFSYDPTDDHSGPGHWTEISPCCGGTQQSPIDIPYSSIAQACFGTLYFSNPGTVRATVMNNGHTLKCSDFTRTMTMTNVPHSPGDTFNLLQVHLHWGLKNVLASEHKLNGQGYIGEMHLVFYNTKYGSSKEAMRNPDGLAVVGVFLIEGFITVNWDLKNLLKGSASCTNPNVTTTIQLNPSLLLPLNREYVTYPGSLTTPPCSQNVRWILMLDTLTASFTEMDELRKLMEDSGHTIASHTNERAVQSLNGRSIQFNNCQNPIVG